MIQEKEESMNEYNSMAFNYEDQGDFLTASYFYNKVIDIASSCKVNSILLRTSNSNWWPYWGWESVLINKKTKTKQLSCWKEHLTMQIF